MHVPRVEDEEVPDLWFKRTALVACHEVWVIAIGTRVAIMERIRSPLDVVQRRLAATDWGEVEIEDGLLRDAIDDPVLGVTVVGAPVTMDGRSVVDAAEDARKVVLAVPFASNRHVPFWYQSSEGGDDSGPDVFADGCGEVVVQ